MDMDDPTRPDRLDGLVGVAVVAATSDPGAVEGTEEVDWAAEGASVAHTSVAPSSSARCSSRPPRRSECHPACGTLTI